VSRRGPLTCLSVVRLLPLAGGEVRANTRQKNSAFKNIEDVREASACDVDRALNIARSKVAFADDAQEITSTRSSSGRDRSTLRRLPRIAFDWPRAN